MLLKLKKKKLNAHFHKLFILESWNLQSYIFHLFLDEKSSTIIKFSSILF